jgi:hypothetical protein
MTAPFFRRGKVAVGILDPLDQNSSFHSQTLTSS